MSDGIWCITPRRRANNEYDMKCTEWYDASVQPTRDGVYECEFASGDVYYNLFLNGVWYCGYKRLERCNRWLDVPLDEDGSVTRLVRWRGLTSEAEMVDSFS